MKAYILSLKTPYFTRIKKDSTYFLGNLPDGKYRLEVFHPAYPSYKTTIQVGGQKAIKHDIRWQ